MHVELTTADQERFESHVYRIPGGCWIWLAYTDPRGYGRFRAADRMLLAHRAAWLLYRGPIPAGFHVLHDCTGGDWPGCVNPWDCLWLGTHQDNQTDKARKGRGRRGRLPYGVWRWRSGGRFGAQVRINGKLNYLGSFDTIEEAHEVALAATKVRVNPKPYIN